MPCVSGRAEMSSVRGAAMVRAFRRECGICTLFNGSGKNHLAYAAYFGPFPSRSSLHCSVLGHFHQYVQTAGFPCPGKLAIGVEFAAVSHQRGENDYHGPTQAGVTVPAVLLKI